MSDNLLTYRVRLSPNKQQERYFRDMCRAIPFVFNFVKDADDRHYAETNKRLSDAKLNSLFVENKQMILDKLGIDYAEHHTLREGVDRYIGARDRAFKKVGRWPKFQSNKYRRVQSFFVRTDGTRNTSTINNGDKFVRVPGLFSATRNSKVRSNLLHCKKIAIPETGITAGRIVWDGKYWYLQFAYKVQFEPRELNSHSRGVDVGIKDLAVMENGQKIKPTKADKRLAKLERRKVLIDQRLAAKRDAYKAKLASEKKLAKQENREPNQIRLSKNYYKCKDSSRVVGRNMAERKKHLEITAAKQIIQDLPKRVVLESLAVSEMKSKARNKSASLRSGIHHAGWYGLFMRIEHEAAKAGIKVVRPGRYYPSTKKCSRCGNIKQIPLTERTYSCDNCGLTIDRDVNAAINLSRYGERGSAPVRRN